MLFLAEKGFHTSIEATVQAIQADRFILDVPDAMARVEKWVEL
jgi:hypothetical protein